MEQKKSSIILDNIFTIFAVFFLTLIWIRFKVHNTFLVLFLTSIITMLICSIFHIFFKKKHKKIKIIKKEQEKIKNISNYLLFESKTNILKIFQKNFLACGIITNKKGDFLYFKNLTLTCLYNNLITTEKEVLEIIVKAKNLKIKSEYLIICSKSFTSDAKEIIKQCSAYKIILYDENLVYKKIFKPSNFELKENVKVKKSKKEIFLNLIYIAFNKDRFKGYLFSAIILLIGSYFLRYNLYYLIMSSILIVFSFISRFNKKFNSKNYEVKFESIDSEKKLP